MTKKIPIRPDRIRKVPNQFSWVDHRLVRDRHIEQLSHAAAALYLFLITVGDAKGLSYYSDPSIIKRLAMDAVTLEKARSDLIRAEMIAWKKPLYQVLSLDKPQPPAPSRASLDQPMALGDIFKQAMEGKR
jgi:hypothetical protein